MDKNLDSNNKISVKIQSVAITIGGICSSAINGIVAYIAVYFFKPIWEKYIINIWKERGNDE